MADISERIREARRGADLTQEAVARRADLSVNMVSRLELGKIRDPHISTLRGIAHAVGVPVEALVAEDMEPAPLAEASATGHELIFRQAYESAEDFDAVFERALEEARSRRASYLERGMRLSVSDDGKSVALYAVEHEAGEAR